MSDITLYNDDCFNIFPQIEDKSVDMICCDLPYGVLNKSNKSAQWDSILPFDKLWEEYERVIKDNGAIVLFGQGMFSAELMLSNKKLWRYNLIWDKNRTSGFLNANRMPLRKHEDIMVFYKKLPIYNPQMEKCEPHQRNHNRGKMDKKHTNRCYGNFADLPTVVSDEKFPTSIISISTEHKNGKFFHPTQKPIALLEYLIKTYTNEGYLVLDNCMGSGTCGIACKNLNRNFIGVEKEKEYFDIAEKRINETIKEQTLFDV